MYKSVLTFWDGAENSQARMDLAIELVRQSDGHLTVVAPGYEPDMPPYAFAGAGAGGSLYMNTYARAREEAEKYAEEAASYLEKAGVNGEAVPIVCPYSNLPGRFGRMARFSDLVVVEQPYGTDNEQASIKLLEGALFEGDAPALVCPRSQTVINTETVLIAWNGSREALRATRRALPLLADATSIEIAVVDPEASEEVMGEDFALMLSRHGLKVSLNSIAARGNAVGDVLRQRVLDIGAGLIVMGAYGHSRFREYVIGGVTRDILEDVPVPVFMAH